MCHYVRGENKRKLILAGDRMLGLEWDYCICIKKLPEHKDGSKISI